MISFEVYKIVHLSAIFLFLTGVAVMLVSGKPSRMWSILTGIASLLILIAGFGMLARLHMMNFPPWVVGKLVIWLVLTGAGHMVAKRFPAYGMIAYWCTILLSIVAAGLAIYKPV